MVPRFDMALISYEEPICGDRRADVGIGEIQTREGKWVRFTDYLRLYNCYAQLRAWSAAFPAREAQLKQQIVTLKAYMEDTNCPQVHPQDPPEVGV